MKLTAERFLDFWITRSRAQYADRNGLFRELLQGRFASTNGSFEAPDESSPGREGGEALGYDRRWEGEGGVAVSNIRRRGPKEMGTGPCLG